MKKVLIFLLCCLGTAMFSQGKRGEYSLKPIFDVDTTGTFGGSIVIANNFDAVRLVNETLYVNAGTDYLARTYAQFIAEDSLLQVADTILYRIYPLYIKNEEDSLVYDTIVQKHGFFWKKSVAEPDVNLIAPNLYAKGEKDWGCITYLNKKQNNVCSYVKVCKKVIVDIWCNDKVYTKTFEDNFDGDEIDTKYWKIGFPWGRMVNPQGIGWATKDNVIVNNGTLKLITKPYAGSYTESYPDYYYTKGEGIPYLEGTISANFKTGYGKYEMRAKIPPIHRVNPAYWLSGNGIEIDGFEFFKCDRGNRPTMSVYSSKNNGCDPVYTNGNNTIHRISEISGGPLGGEVWPDLPNLSDGQWRIFTLVYDPNYIAWWIRDESTNKHWALLYFRKQNQQSPNMDPYTNCSCSNCTTRTNECYPDQNNNINFIVGNGAYNNQSGVWIPNNFPGNGGTWAPGPALFCGGIPTPETQMEIDWIKIYQEDKCGQDFIIEDRNPFKYENNPGNYENNSITGDNITLGGGQQNNKYFKVNGETEVSPNKLLSWFPLFVRANEEVRLLDGFEAHDGSLFEATNAFRGSQQDPADCNNPNHWPQYLRSAVFSSENNTPKIIENINAVNELVIIPNPTDGIFKLATKSNQELPKKVIIYDMMGRIVKTIDAISSSELDIDLQRENPGIYVVSVYYTNIILRKPVVKN